MVKDNKEDKKEEKKEKRKNGGAFGEGREVRRYEPDHWISPWRDIMERFFDENWLEPFERWPGQIVRRVAPAFPKVDVSETDKEVKVIADIPGVSPQDIEINVEDDRLTLSGKVERKKEEGERGGRYYRYEREFGQFRREVGLPVKVVSDKASAKSKNGVLTIVLPKAEGEKRKKIKIEEEK